AQLTEEGLLILIGAVRHVGREELEGTRAIGRTAGEARVGWIQRDLTGACGPWAWLSAVEPGIIHGFAVLRFPPLGTGTPGYVAAWQFQRGFATEHNVHSSVPVKVLGVTLVEQPFDQLVRVFAARYVAGVAQTKYRLTG